VLLDSEGKPAATASSWQYDHLWNDREHGSVIFVGVRKELNGRGLARQMVNHVLCDLRRRGFSVAALDVLEDNFPALKTYIRCGFTPQLESPEQLEHWLAQYKRLGMPPPSFDHSVRPRKDTPHPARPWPYQLKMAAQAAENGEIYLFGIWYRHNLYEVDRSEYPKLSFLFGEAYRAAWDSAQEGGQARLFIDRPRSPRAAFLVPPDGDCVLTGEPCDTRFTAGIQAFLDQKAARKG